LYVGTVLEHQPVYLNVAIHRGVDRER